MVKQINKDTLIPLYGLLNSSLNFLNERTVQNGKENQQFCVTIIIMYLQLGMSRTKAYLRTRIV